MSHYAYLGVLVGCLLGTLWLEFLLRTRVYRRTLRLVLSIIPVLILFAIWDAYAIAQNHWYFDPKYVTGITTIANIPIEEISFFIVIPICSILTLEAVRSAKGWAAGDEEVSK